MTIRALAVVAGAAFLAGCADPTGPVVGDWRGLQPSRADIYQTSIELVLDGSPGATTGTYHYRALTNGALIGLDERQFRWSDRWEQHPAVVDGRQMALVHLDRLGGPRVPDYIRTPDNLLVPVPNLSRPDLSPNALRVALYPVARDSFGYGRL